MIECSQNSVRMHDRMNGYANVSGLAAEENKKGGSFEPPKLITHHASLITI